jgi:hypothetical protein
MATVVPSVKAQLVWAMPSMCMPDSRGPRVLQRLDAGFLLCGVPERDSGESGANFGFSGGDRVVEIRFWVPEAIRVAINDYATTPQGFVLAGTATSGQGARAGYLAYLDKAGETKRVVRVSPFEATSIAACANGTVWLLGSVTGAGDHDIVQRFDAQGNLLGTHVPGSSFRKAQPPFHPGVHDEYSPSRIRCYERGVMVVSTAGDEIVLLNPDGSEKARLPLARPGLGAPPPSGVLRGSDGLPLPHALLGGLAVALDGTLYGDFLVTGGEAVFSRSLNEAAWKRVPLDEAGTVIGVHEKRAVRLNVRTKSLLVTD